MKALADASPVAPRPLPPSAAHRRTAAEDWLAMLAAVEQQLVQRGHGQATLATESVQALRCLHGLLAAERAAMHDGALRLDQAERLLAETRAALAASRRREREANRRSLHDSLTGLPNRASFRSQLDAALQRATPPDAVAVLILDLDGFKPVNDTHGHATGDELLKVVAARLAGAVRRSDWVARLGGDEFGCVLTGLPGRERLRRLAIALHDAVSAPIVLGPLRLSVRPSIGIAVHDAVGDGDALIRRADAAMFFAKRAGLGHAFCGPGVAA